MPAGLIDEKRRVCARRDLSGDFGQVQVHGLRVASGHDQGCTLSVLGADRAEDISRGGSLVLRRARTRAALGPAAGDLVLLADAGLVGEPDLYGGGLDASRARSRPGARESFFKILDRALSLRVMTGTSRELTISHGAQFQAQCLLGDDAPEFLEDPLAEVDDPPAP